MSSLVLFNQKHPCLPNEQQALTMSKTLVLSCATRPSGLSQTVSLLTSGIDSVTFWCLVFKESRIHRLCVCKSMR